MPRLPGDGPTWLNGFVSLPDKSGAPRLVASYRKIKPPLATYEAGLCIWNDETENFEPHKVIWARNEGDGKRQPVPDGHVTLWTDDAGKRWALFGDPLPRLRMPATFEAWQDPATWEVIKPQERLPSAADGKQVKPHTGSIAWNAYRQRWVTVFMESFGKPSAFGELWYAEADCARRPLGSGGQSALARKLHVL